MNEKPWSICWLQDEYLITIKRLISSEFPDKARGNPSQRPQRCLSQECTRVSTTECAYICVRKCVCVCDWVTYLCLRIVSCIVPQLQTAAMHCAVHAEQ